jgi:DNA-directed RNA polymerase subunit RPC12/RpoP
MKILKKLSQSRRDFTAIYVCEHCGKEVTGSGYDDSYFHQKVIPAMKCAECGKIADADYLPIATKYPDSMQV